MMIGKCPVCGYSSRENREHIKSKSELLNKRHIEVRLSISTVSKYIRDNRTNDNSDEKEIRFLTRIMDISIIRNLSQLLRLRPQLATESL